MLRRKPTAITLTSEDVAAYEDSLLARMREENNKPQSASSPMRQTPGKEGAKIDPNDELKPLPGDRARISRIGASGGAHQGASREERIMGR